MYKRQPAGWHILSDVNFIANAIAVDGNGLLLGVGEHLYRYHYGDEDPTPILDLSSIGITRIEGMSLSTDDTLYLIDGDDQEMVELANWR